MSATQGPVQTEPQTGTAYLYFVSLTAAVGGFLFGYDLNIITGAMLFMQDYFGIEGAQLGFLTSSAIFGCIFGALLATWIADAAGRRNSLHIAAVLFFISAVWSALATTIPSFAIARAIGGVGVGIATGVSPMYIAEIAPAHLRGRMVTVNQLSIVAGIVLSVVVALLLSYGGHWRIMFASECVPVVALMAGLLFVPLSPRWLASRGRTDEALRILTRVNGVGRAEAVMEEIRVELARETGAFKELLRPGVRQALIVACILMIFQQVNGVNMMLIYASKILVEAGIGSISNALLNSLMVYFLIFFSTIVAFYIVAKFPRRAILMAGVAAMAVGHIVMAAAFHLKASPFVNLLAMLIATGAFTLTLAPLGWVVVSEFFPNRVRGKCMGIVTFCLFTSSFLCTWAFPNLTALFENRYGTQAGAYLLFAAICLACVWFVWRYVPETKDHTLEEIGTFWLNRGKAATRALKIE